MEYPYKTFGENSCTWWVNYHNRFIVSKDGLTGIIGDFREGGNCEGTSFQDLIDGKINLGWGGNSIFMFCGSDGEKDPDSVKKI